VREALAKIGEPVLVGSVVSNLMVRREIDVTFKVGRNFGRADAVAVAHDLWSSLGACGVILSDEVRRPGDITARDDRFHIEVRLQRPPEEWCLDLSLFLHDDHRNVAQHHGRLRDLMSAAQRRRILELKDEHAPRTDAKESMDIYDEVVGPTWRVDD
jgi:hypothetical protein